MKEGKGLLPAVLFIIFLIPLAAFASYPVSQYPTITPIEKMHPNGNYAVYIEKEGKWQEAGSISFDKYFRDREIDLTGYISNKGKIRVRLVQQGGGAAHMDSVSLGDKSPIQVRDIVNGVKKLSKNDFDVIDAFNKCIEMTFPLKRNSGILKLTARVESATISKVPFQFPVANLYKKMSLKSKFYAYEMKTKETASPFFQEYSLTGSGHPSGYTYGWVRHDKENLYVKIDFTPDNTMDGDKDYAAVYIKTENGIKEYKMSMKEKTWGTPAFTYTDKVSYQHKVYDFAIPLKEIDIKDAKNADEIKLAFAAYGTAVPATTCLYYYEALIDVDNKHSTGGPVHVVQAGASADIPGIDYKVRALVNAETQQIYAIEIWTWNNNTSLFDLTTSTPYKYSIGIGNGYQYNLEKADVVEFLASRAALGNPQGTMKIVYHASMSASPFNDYTGPFYDPPLPASIPTISQWGMIILSLLLGVAALLVIRKRKTKIVKLLSSLLIVLSITGIVSANFVCPDKICLDGLIEDWNEIAATPAVTDPYGDSSTGNEWEDIVAGYITSDTNNIYFRIDFVGGSILACEM